MLLAGQVLRDRYQIQRQLGQNAGRHTLLAQDLQTQEPVVLKLLSFNSSFRWEDLKLFEREAKTLQSLSHPAIPRYLDYFEFDQPNDRGFVLVQTYLDAPSLQQWIEQGRSFSEAEVQNIAQALLKVLSDLHANCPPVIHRDIKPSNILLKGDRTGHQVGELYLVDFGSVQTAVREMGTMTVVGTYGYMPPEQFSGRAFPASDLYSLGATLIYLVTGTHPADLLQEDLHLKFQPLTPLTPKFARWLETLTHPVRKQRFSDAQAALQALENPDFGDRDQIVHRPERSKITLHRTADCLEIHIPAPKSSGISQGCSLIILGLVGAIALSWLPVVLTSGNLSSLLISLFFVYVVGSGYWLYFYSSRADIHIEIGPQQFKVTQRAFGIQKLIFRANRENLYKITLTKRFYRRDPEAGIVEVPPELKIWSTLHPQAHSTKHLAIVNPPSSQGMSYRIGGSLGGSDPESQFFGGLTSEELEWLAQELSNELSLPIVRQ
ncbi:serine/threonine protein kinase [Desertifilum sp. FACHB-1129]|uniref:Protein kinase domain-containing protein n=1 Tax=Desertifilum tharense IPPAS B-1220 TaxID=1781255 RepID=A0A1E5QQC8_9CYAN|nr:MULTISPECIES: serine/threonine-protein kinase [Desertifilum]MDA0209249.1 serine/threonine-protein kinase [Cyanobacteria bacterium FC1]MBD2311903.1 serine/threonine protein kinase [Desertifilum sp. FACHB-1129]MBD2323048.1 serine/threonine protein kinase [Desertifilum sp. FACHB-866]MBD2333479.1 serine/threonine protein kinase [Desertifilum sp. FACHB-868]OEJ76885.1 hypothetical protein BH720_02605 [Desertifilum tharense IPPAS B-1220]